LTPYPAWCCTGRIHAVLHEFLDVDGFADVLGDGHNVSAVALDSFAVANAVTVSASIPYSVGYGLEQVLV
jgi:hypothetical protein